MGIFFLQNVLDGVLKWIGLVKFTRTVEQGASCEYLAATSEEAESGKYYELVVAEGTAGGEGGGEKLRTHASSLESYDEEKAKALWTKTEEAIAAVLGADAVPKNEAANKGVVEVLAKAPPKL